MSDTIQTPSEPQPEEGALPPADAIPGGEAAREMIAAPPAEPREADAPLPPGPEPPSFITREHRAAADLSVSEHNAVVEMQIHRMSRRSFLWGAAAVAASFAGWKWLATRPEEDGLPWPFRRALETNEHLARDYFSAARLAPTFPRAMAKEPRPNGDLGLSEDFDPAEWRLRVEGLAEIPEGMETDEESSDPALLLALDDIKRLPRVEMVMELKCVEGWSQVVQWAGARLADFIRKYPPATRSGDPLDLDRRPDDLPGYVSLETPDQGYYVGLERESALHPQTLLCYEMNGAPLTLEHGAPLRLVIPVKYGIKNLKRIGTIRFTDRRPADYWAEQGYDWYAGH
ncbi:MAG TPA: molybdopterin-dependent oxidoreductase [Chthonomonadaceae bacterium]|nr:molybdopterin-dependent oxidoreductase [Chthonomonadaceae bacterium]